MRLFLAASLLVGASFMDLLALAFAPPIKIHNKFSLMSSPSSSSSRVHHCMNLLQKKNVQLLRSVANKEGGGEGEVKQPSNNNNNNFSPDLLVDMQACLQTLEKRVTQGPGALSMEQVSEFDAAMGRILKDMHENKRAPLPTQKVVDVQHHVPPTTQKVADVQHHVPPPPTITARNAVKDEHSSLPTAPAAKKEEEIMTTPMTMMNGSPPPPPQQEEDDDDQLLSSLQIAASNLDVETVARILDDNNMTMDEATTDAAFWAVVHAVDRAEELDRALGAEIPQMLHRIFEADHHHLLQRTDQHERVNVTCMQPDDEDDAGGAARRMNYIFDDASHKDLPLKEGRRCEDGACCDACSRNIFYQFCTDAEINLETFPELASFTFNDLEQVSAATILQFVRLIERVRRTMAHEYGLPLGSILPLQTYSRKYVAGTTQRGGGGGEGDFVTLHTDEATHSGYHYSCVLYLSTEGVDFEGGAFVFNDPADKSEEDGPSSSDEEDDDEEEEEHHDYVSLADEIRRAGRKLTPFHPKRGAAVIFSSGWENMHEVEQITSGIRYAVPSFFTTCPVPEAAYEQMKVGKPQTNEDIADDWLHLLLAHRKETPIESVGRVKELLMKWHYMCTPLSMH